MKKTKQKILRLIVFLSFISISNLTMAQLTSVNREWMTGYGNPVFNPLLSPYGGDWTKSIISANGEVITVAHTFVSGQGENVLLTRFDDSGTPIWQVDYNSSSSYNDYGINLIEASNGDIYVCGTTDKGGTTDYDVLILIFDSNGNLIYDKRYDGPDGKNDIPGAIAIDGSGNIIIAGTSESNSTSYDYLVLSYDLSLNLNWSNTYDYANLVDIAAQLVIDGGKITLAGASANSATDWDMTTVDFDESNGSYQGDNRMNYPGFGYDEIYAFKKDANDYTYATGKCSSNGTNYNIRTVKVDSTNTLLWSQTYDAFGLEDVGSSITIDANGNVIVGGFITKSNNKKNLIILKYSPSGTLLWKYTQPSNDPNHDAAIKALSLNSTNDNIYYIGGDKKLGGNKRAIVGRINSNGIKNWERGIEGNYNHLPSDIQYGGVGMLGIYAITILDSTVNTYKLTQFTELDHSDSTTTTASGLKYAEHESIIRFDKKTIKTAMIDNLDKEFGSLSDFIQDSTITKMDIVLNTGESCADWKAWKIFPKMTTTDTLSQTRMGNYIKIPEFYCAIQLSFPFNINTINAINSIKSIKPDIYYSEVNYVGESTAVNDPNYNVQSSLHPTTSYTNAHINADSAWVISNGENHVKVGVFDTGINSSHEDFGGYTVGGYNYATNSSGIGSDFVDHGTTIAGIIGAVRNNSKGIAGIAGGNDSISKQGVALYDCVISLTGSYYYGTSANALFDASKSTSNGGLGIHIANNSFRFGNSSDGWLWTVGNDSFNLYSEQINFANRNGVVYIGAKGNNNIKSYTFPSDFADGIQMSVGSSGDDGQWCKAGTNCSHGSFYGGYLDFVAPGSTVIINSTSTNGNYKYVGGTSHAAPHVAGAVALMMSYYNKPIPDWDNLVHEDCENILRRTATDLTVAATYSQTVGRDAVTGWGKINTYQALKSINKNYWKVFHIDQNHYVTSSSKTFSTIVTNTIINWPAINSAPSGTYATNIIEVTTTLNYSFPNNYVIVDYWPLYKECRGWMDSLFNGVHIRQNMPFYSKVISVNSTQSVLKTYYFVKTINGQTYPEVNGGFHRSAISLLVYDPNAAIGLTENLINQKNFITFPNPSRESFNVVFGSDLPSGLEYKVYDLLGKEVLTGFYKTQYGKNTIVLDMQNKPEGLYILNVTDGGKLVYTQKIIKN